MSLDVDVAPCSAAWLSWGALCDCWREKLGERGSELLGAQPQLRRIGDKQVVSSEQCLSPLLAAYFELGVPNALSLTIMYNEGNLDELEYIEDYGGNLDGAEMRRLADMWRKAGYFIGLSSAGGRSADEPVLLRTLACALAELTGGRVILMNDGWFNLGVGVYTAEVFSAARWMS